MDRAAELAAGAVTCDATADRHLRLAVTALGIVRSLRTQELDAALADENGEAAEEEEGSSMGGDSGAMFDAYVRGASAL